MGDAATDPQPLEVPLTGHRRVLVDVDGPDWRVAFYYPSELPHGKVVELEKRALTGSQRDRDALARLKMARGSGRAPVLREALLRAMTRTVVDRRGVPQAVPPALPEVEQVAAYILEGRYAERVGRSA